MPAPGDPIAITAYLGKSDASLRAGDRRFLGSYADQNERDYKAFKEAIRSGRLQAVSGV